MDQEINNAGAANGGPFSVLTAAGANPVTVNTITPRVNVGMPEVFCMTYGTTV